MYWAWVPHTGGNEWISSCVIWISGAGMDWKIRCIIHYKKRYSIACTYFRIFDHTKCEWIHILPDSFARAHIALPAQANCEIYSKGFSQFIFFFHMNTHWRTVSGLFFFVCSWIIEHNWMIPNSMSIINAKHMSVCLCTLCTCVPLT